MRLRSMLVVSNVCCALLSLGASAVLSSSEWYSGVIHVHTTFSDGSDNIPQRVEKAKGLGYKFLLITDHYEQVNSKDKLPAKSTRVLYPGGLDVGFADYVGDCAKRTKNGEFVTIPGAEIQAIWKAESNTQDMSHTLALGPLGDSGSKDLDKLLSASGGQREIIACVNDKMRMLPTAAHPTLISEHSFPKVWEWQRCRYDLREPAAYEGIRGVEFFNCDTVQQSRDVLSWYLTLVKERKSVFVTSGCDSHGWNDTKDGERWQRATWVFADGLSTNGVLGALADGRSYASAHGAYIREMNYPPGRSAQTVDRPGVQFTVSFPKAITSPKTIVIYRDGAEVPGSRRTFQKGLSDLRYDWSDTTVDTGEHCYVMWIEGCLVTSPIRLRVVGMPPKPDRLPATSQHTETDSGALYRDQADESIKAELRKLWSHADPSQTIIVNERDLQRVSDYNADRRVVQMLVDLAKRHVLAVRIAEGYNDEKHWLSRETQYPPGEMPNISAHYRGQAFDVFYADGVEIAWQVSKDPAKRRAAQQKIRDLIKEMFALGRKDDNQLPTQVLIYGAEDADCFAGDIAQLYGKTRAERGNSGIIVGPRLWDRIHVGY